MKSTYRTVRDGQQQNGGLQNGSNLPQKFDLDTQVTRKAQLRLTSAMSQPQICSRTALPRTPATDGPAPKAQPCRRSSSKWPGTQLKCLPTVAQAKLRRHTTRWISDPASP
ncbi:unnamed protein product [Prunus armeniaca]